MKKLLSMELKRAVFSPVLWIGCAAIILKNIYKILLSAYGFTIYTTSFLFSNSGFICIIMAILLPLHIGHDFEVRTINNKISAGYSRKQIYLTEGITGGICTAFLFLADIISVFVCSALQRLTFSEDIPYSAFLFHAIISFVCLLTISSLYTMLVMVLHRQLISIGIVVILSLSLLSFGGNTVSDLRQPELWNDPVTQVVEDNPLYLNGLKRTAANLHLFVSPFAQAAYQSHMLVEPESKENCSLLLKDLPYHFEFCMINLLEILLFCQIGIRIFRKQDLK